MLVTYNSSRATERHYVLPKLLRGNVVSFLVAQFVRFAERS